MPQRVILPHGRVCAFGDGVVFDREEREAKQASVNSSSKRDCVQSHRPRHKTCALTNQTEDIVMREKLG